MFRVVFPRRRLFFALLLAGLFFTQAPNAHALRIEGSLLVAKLAQILLVPTGLLLGAILLAPDSWKVAAFVGALWFLLPAARGRVLIAYIALFASVTLWIVYSADTAVAFPLALVPLLLAALLPGRKWGINDDYDPASGVAR